MQNLTLVERAFQAFCGDFLYTKLGELGEDFLRSGGERRARIFYRQSFRDITKITLFFYDDVKLYVKFLSEYLNLVNGNIEKYGGFVHTFNEDYTVALFDDRDNVDFLFELVDAMNAGVRSLFDKYCGDKDFDSLTIALHADDILLVNIGSEKRLVNLLLGYCMDFSEWMIEYAEKNKENAVVSENIVSKKSSHQFKEAIILRNDVGSRRTMDLTVYKVVK